VRLSQRLARLGSETAFAVSAEAAAFAARGNRVFPFHLGDINIPTPENIVQASLQAIRDGKTGYCPNYGIAPLRELIAANINASHGTHYTMANVAVEPGGKPVICKFILAAMNPGDEVLYPTPGYPIYESQIEFHGGVARAYSYREGRSGFEIDLGAIECMITPRTRLLILNDLENPTGAEASPDELKRLAELCVKHDLYVLCDEAYFDIRYSGRSRSLTSLPGMEERCVILYTFSKKYAMTGWRLGAAVGPKDIIDVIAKLNVNDESCSNHFIQYGAVEALTGDQSGCAKIIDTLRARRDKAFKIVNSIPGVCCFRPEVTFYLFPNVTELMRRMKLTDYDAFRVACLQKTGVSFCTRRHFGRPLEGEKQFYIRLAYSGIDLADVEEGLTRLKQFAESL
jgi:aspartate/methionine/tyrosine aminotransferase